MKVETSKNQVYDRKESKNVFKTETSVFDSSSSLKATNAPPAPTTGAFAKILEETRQENEKHNQPGTKTETAENESKTSKSERDEKLSRAAEEKAEEKNGKHEGGGDASQNGDEHQAQANALSLLQAQTNLSSDVSQAPPARAILHVADLERIVSTIRTETFQNQKQVIIALKNSVLQGLQIKLTLTENGQLKAEFLALNEQIKKQLNQRKNELSEVLKNRSAMFTEVEIESQNENTNG